MQSNINKPSLSIFLFSALLAVAAAPVTAEAAAGDLYDGGLNQNVIYKFNAAAPVPVQPTVFVSGPFADYLAFDNKGNLFVSDPQAMAILKITPTGSTSTFASGIRPTGLAFDQAGNLFAGDSLSNSIFKYTPTGVRSTFALGIAPNYLTFNRSGILFVTVTGPTGPNGSIVAFGPLGSRSTFATGLSSPQGLAFDPAGNLLEADLGTASILKFSPTGVKTTFASGALLVGGLHLSPRSLAFDRSGNLFEGDFGNNRILKFAPNGAATIFASNPSNPFFVGGLAFEPATADLVNISTRLLVQSGNNVAIGGFIVTGTDLKRVVIRGIGPSLNVNGIPVPGRLSDPTLELHNQSTQQIIGRNDNWKINDQTGLSQQAEVEATTVPPVNDLESAIVTTLAPGGYTAVLTGKNGSTGVGQVEVYDLAPAVNAPLANISTRGVVQTGTNVMIGGFILNGGNGFGDVIVRAIGPSLPASVSRLADPTLVIKDANGTAVASNDNWKSSQQAAIVATGIPPTNDLESAVVLTLPAGGYTAIVAGKNGGTGVGQVEIYKLR